MSSTKDAPATSSVEETQPLPDIFPAEEEQALLSSSNTEKATANKIFTTGAYTDAIQGYEKALAICPNYLEYDIAVLHANIAACHLKLLEWKAAVDSATKALDALDLLDPPAPVSTTHDDAAQPSSSGTATIAEVDDRTELHLSALNRTGKSLHDIHRLRTKALLRRAKARHNIPTWASLQAALEDYTALLRPPHTLSSLDRSAVTTALKQLPAEVQRAREDEMADMMGKLKQLGNGILKPFGLSTENFRLEKGEGGGYSVQFDQAAGKKEK
ncbi:hypothetical protein ACN47E_007581 [Coniothyrium glycines]